MSSETLLTGPSLATGTAAEEWDDRDEFDEEFEDGEGDEDDELDAAAEEIARRLGDQLWADISKAQADRVAIAVGNGAVNGSAHLPTLKSPVKDTDVIATMKHILNHAAADPLAYSTLSSTTVPGTNDASVWTLLNDAVAVGKVSKETAWPLSQQVIALAKSEVLFSSLRHSNASALQLDKGKRKRETSDYDDQRMLKRPAVSLAAPRNLHIQLSQAVDIIIRALSTHVSTTDNLDPSLISSIQPQLYQVFLFAVTSSATGGQDMNTLQELSGLIQVLGVLSGVQIAPTTGAPTSAPHSYANPDPQTSADIGTAVYPCLMPNCRKTFSRLYGLRAHQRVHAVGRPFRCEHCPASFARNHDLKRHIKGHETKAFKCCGCLKVFSRRDALKRHKNTSRKGASPCIDATVEEVEVDRAAEEEAKEGRRAKLWSGIGTATGSEGTGNEDPEDGEIEPDIIKRAQADVLRLYAPLQTHVTSALGTSPRAVSVPSPSSPRQEHATLASVIARAQSQNPVLPVSLPHQADSSTSSQTQKPPASSLSMYGLSSEQAWMLEQAIADAASAAQAQAEAEALLEEGYEDVDEDDNEDEGYDDPEGGNVGG